MSAQSRPTPNEPSESDTTQARVFLTILTEQIADSSVELEQAALAAAAAKRSHNKGAERRAVNRAEDLRDDLDELRRQVRAVLRRFPSAADRQAGPS